VTALVAVTFPASVFVTVNERGPVVAVESAVTTTRRQLDVARALVASIGGSPFATTVSSKVDGTDIETCA
jgi:hypothetical protein